MLQRAHTAILAILHTTVAFKSFHIVEENRHIPPWPSYQYDTEVEGNLAIREYILQEQDQRSYLLCPKGFVIGQLGVALLLGADQIEKDPGLKAKQVTFLHQVGEVVVASDWGDRVQPQGEQGVELCPTLTACLMHQACVFNFGNELCLRDPNPGTRKNLDVNVTCVRDSAFEELLKQAETSKEVMEQAREKKDQVLNIMYDSKLDYGIEDFPNTVLNPRTATEDFVFRSSCPSAPATAGYGGDCGSVAGLGDGQVGLPHSPILQHNPTLPHNP